MGRPGRLTWLPLLLWAVFLTSWGADAAEEAPPRIYAGVYLIDVSAVDLKAGRFDADLELWLKWRGGPTPPPISVVNGDYEEQQLAQESQGDWHMVRRRLRGTFRGTFPLHRFPFDEQELGIELSLPANDGALLPDLASSGMAEEFSITGWIYQRHFRAEQHTLTIPSDFGALEAEGEARRTQVLRFVVDVSRPIAAYTLKFVLPLLIILGMAVLAAFVPTDNLDVRAGMGVTALLSCVAFHFSQADSLPDMPYLVAADLLFLGAYVLILFTLVESVVAFRLLAAKPTAAERLDFWTTRLIPTAALAGILTIGFASHQSGDPIGPSSPAPVTAAVRSQVPLLRVGVVDLKSLSAGGLSQLLRRGLAPTDAEGVRTPHLVDVVPATSNDRVRFLTDGGMTVLWRLRPGLKFNDGTPITSEDLRFSALARQDSNRAEVQVIDALSILVRYTKRHPEAVNPFTIYSHRALQETFAAGGTAAMEKHLAQEPLPTEGPFRLVRFEPGKAAELERNPHFAGVRPALDRVSVRSFPTSLALAEALSRGEIDFAPVFNAQGAEALGNTPGIVVRRVPSNLMALLQPDLSVPLFQDRRVREALLLALDREGLAVTLFGEGARAAHSFVSEGMPGFQERVRRYPHDPSAARALLVEAGLSLPVKVTFQATSILAGTSQELTYQKVISDLEEGGFKVEPHFNPGAKTVEQFSSGRHGGLLFFTRRASEDPAFAFNLPRTPGGFDDQTPRPHFPVETARHFARLATTLFVERRESISAGLQLDFAERLPILPIAFGLDNSAQVAALEGVNPGSGSLWWNAETWHLGAPSPAEAKAVATDAIP
ncbi:MAG: ABC transporter substrate-binding protein [Myxococcota bacterium]|nr:ABC transporter substrate-binding protein [Myxococcota bacterium]